VASDTIHREMFNLRAAGKPVVVSMGDYAASGGYYIATPATHIVAQVQQPLMQGSVMKLLKDRESQAGCSPFSEVCQWSTC
jgi:hypothetical protein